MMSIIFNIIRKFIEKKKGAVEYIESAIVFPIIVLFISVLVFISFITINKSIALESIYINSRKIVNEVDDDFNLIKRIDKTYLKETEKLQNQKLQRLNQNDLTIYSKENLIKNTIRNYDGANNRIYLQTGKTYTADATRKIDFINYIYDDIKDISIKGYSLTSIFDDIKSSSDKFIQKIKK